MQLDPKRIGSVFLTGLIVLLPVTVTLLFLSWLLRHAEAVFGPLIEPVLGRWYYPGMGMALGLVFVFLVGLLAQVYFFQKLLLWSDELLERIPLVKTVYGAVRDLLTLFQGNEKSKFGKVVRVRIPGTDFHVIGFVTREDFTGFPAGLAGPDVVAVYLPLSYQIGGHTVFVPRAQLEQIDMSFEDAMRFTVTAGLSGSEQRKDAPEAQPDPDRTTPVER